MKPNHLFHKQGGRIVKIHTIGHHTYKGVADWYFVADVEWSDGTKSKLLEVAPYALCTDSGHPGAKIEIDGLMEKMNGYLAKHGEWHEAKRKKDGRIVHWTPKKPMHAISV